MARASDTPPLLSWPETRAIGCLAAQRADLKRRIDALPRNSHRRIALIARLDELTNEQMRLEIKLERPS